MATAAALSLCCIKISSRIGNTSIRTRIQKNINLLSLEGRAAPALEEREFLGVKPAPLLSFRGKPVLLFFWAHWCPDCKQEEHILAQIAREYAPKGLVMIAPTQRYGYVANGDEASPADELKYIEKIRHQYLRRPARRARARERSQLPQLRRQHHSHPGFDRPPWHRAPLSSRRDDARRIAGGFESGRLAKIEELAGSELTCGIGIKQLRGNKKGPDLSGPICMNPKYCEPSRGAKGLLLFLGGRFLSGLLRSLLSCVLHRLILPNIRFAILDRSVIHI